MLISTMNDVPGSKITAVHGEVFGLIVRSRNLGSTIGAGLKSLKGGELKGMTKMLIDGREHATEREAASLSPTYRWRSRLVLVRRSFKAA